LNSIAASLPTGVYTTNVVFTDLTSGIAQIRQFTLQVLPLILNGGFETGNFTGWTLVGQTTIGNTIYDAVVKASSFRHNAGTNYIHSGTYGCFLGDNQLATLSQTLNTLPGQAYLLSFWLANPASGSGQQFLVNWDTNGTGTNQIYFLNNPPVLTWTNPTFIVTATGTNTTLQFGAVNPSGGFGLDDVSALPIPTTAFQPTTAVPTNNNLQFAWNAMTGLVYLVQYKTNLLQTNWVVLTSIAATNTTTSFMDTNPITTSPQKFYRLLLLP
jgi:hypothetical protein